MMIHVNPFSLAIISCSFLSICFNWFEVGCVKSLEIDWLCKLFIYLELLSTYHESIGLTTIGYLCIDS
jgi:hypothetical protein